ncbi:transglycosylase SLT domain-containing protein [Longimicrobium sp.]|uniref:transglycosylase SLT domain-containing protein n=1 Tax=Longimicrobium sp. TaxID=2029185 RepID=UPI002E37197A|nr:transglycosylase SLT domain-containing protein [Longimicrobium sp.]HEX6042754.1 transglycosylase SLT domain-containing protein [Longimicrobium sp.]
MTEVARPGGRRSYGWRGIPRWMALALPMILMGGVALARTSSSIPNQFGPRAGVPDSLRELRVPVPRTPLAIEPPRYLERVVAKPDSAALVIEAMADRYHITRAMARMVHDAAVEVGLDPELGFRLVRVESVFDPDAVGAGGAAGLVQMMPGTARDLDPKVDTRRELMDPRTNMRLGFGYLRDMIERYEDHGPDAVRLGVIAYNRGEIAVDRALRRGADPENGYGRRILGPRAHGGREYRGRGIMPIPARPDTAQADSAGEDDDS